MWYINVIFLVCLGSYEVFKLLDLLYCKFNWCGKLNIRNWKLFCLHYIWLIFDNIMLDYFCNNFSLYHACRGTKHAIYSKGRYNQRLGENVITYNLSSNVNLYACDSFINESER